MINNLGKCSYTLQTPPPSPKSPSKVMSKDDFGYSKWIFSSLKCVDDTPPV